MSAKAGKCAGCGQKPHKSQCAKCGQLVKRKHKPGGGRAKGSGFERDTAAAIIAAFSAFGITKEDCYRTPGSGGHRFAKKVDPGDLVLSPRLRALFPVSIECKFYAQIKLDWLMVPRVKEGHFYTWWKQAVAATTKDLTTLLVFRQNMGQAYAAFPATYDIEGFEIRPQMIVRIGGDEVRVVRLKSLLRAYKRAAERLYFSLKLPSLVVKDRKKKKKRAAA